MNNKKEGNYYRAVGHTRDSRVPISASTGVGTNAIHDNTRFDSKMKKETL